MVRMSLVARTAVVGGLSAALAMGAAPAMAAAPDAHPAAVQVTKAKQKQHSFWVRVNPGPRGTTVPSKVRGPLTKTKVGANVSLRVAQVHRNAPVKVQLVAQNGKALSPAVTVKHTDAGRTVKLNRVRIKPGTRFYLSLKSASKQVGSSLKGTVLY
ncbi:hypothetical protein [Actinomadura kijaniata]|uniref:hypothetical protein n=1 Tax=Actinomadura kijaniata TaxID=46161 RepID=UPI00082A3DC5|nr:hypothetical protein [Actinomadura kijaniata]